ncbi:hypothetical protein PTKIN_Ptkin01aG0022500 [Pterospermum kingtungense]
MGSFRQQQKQEINTTEVAVPQSWGGGSNRIAAIDVEGTTPDSLPNSKRFDHVDPNHDQKPGWRKFLRFVGPGFLVSLAYIDPGTLQTDFQAATNHGYGLLWVVLFGLVFSLIIQSLAANLGVSTGKHLSELCKAEYPKPVKYYLWLLAEMAVIAADVPEVIGSASALNILFHIPIWVGVLCTGFSTLLLLSVQRYGMRKLEMLMAVLVFVIAGCFFVVMGYVKPPASGVIKGIFVPRLSGQGATGDAIALFGSLITPHNVFLHSGLVLSRKVPNSVRGINDACRYFLIECGFAFLVAFLINVAVVSVTATVCSSDNLSADNQNLCSNLNLDSASFLLKSALGKSSSTIYAISLLASGQSSTISATYAGQFIMQGFLDLKMKGWLSSLMTRSIAIAPSLIASIIGGSHAAGRLIIIANMILSFELPFALIPLLKFSSGSTKMGPYKNSIYILVISWIFVLGVSGINVYFLSTSFVDWLIHSDLPKVVNVFIGIIVFPLMAIYILSTIYLMFRKDTVVTYIEPQMNENDPTIGIESGLGNANADNLPCRSEDIS